jgi:hypothetical protein
MVVKTRSYYQEKQRETAAADVSITISAGGGVDGGQRRCSSRRVKITTPSFQESNTRTYKIYAPVRKSKQRNDAPAADYAEEAAAEALLSLQEHYEAPDQELDQYEQYDSPPPTSSNGSGHAGCPASINHTCLNPMSVITKYMYRISVYNIDQTSHYKTAYIIYDNTTRLYHVYTIISNQIPNEANADTNAANTFVPSATCRNLPEPGNTIQTKYTTYICDMAINYMMMMVIPSKEYDYYIQDDIIGVVIQDHEFRKMAFGTESSFYDIEGLIHDKSSTETITGFKAFMLIPSRNFWYAPAGSYFTTTESSYLSCGENRYTSDTLNSVIMVLSQSN